MGALLYCTLDKQIMVVLKVKIGQPNGSEKLIVTETTDSTSSTSKLVPLCKSMNDLQQLTNAYLTTIIDSQKQNKANVGDAQEQKDDLSEEDYDDEEDDDEDENGHDI